MPSTRTNLTVRLTDERRQQVVLESGRLGVSRAQLVETWLNERIDALPKPKVRPAAKPPVSPARKTGTTAVKKGRNKVTRAA